MKQNILKIFRRLCVPALVLGAFFTSCTDELSSEVAPGGGGKGGETEVTLKLQVPSASAAGKTRAVDAPEESLINDLYVLAFKEDGKTQTFDYYVAARKIDDPNKNGNAKWTANLKVTGYPQTFVMIANAQETNSRVNEQIGALAGTSVGQEKMAVLEKLTETLDDEEKKKGFRADDTGAANHHPFTMYGQTEETTIGSVMGNSLSVSMHRIMARVHVYFTGTAAENATFKPESVSLYNFNDRARVIPADLGETKKEEYEKEPTLPKNPKPVLLPVTVDGTEEVPTYQVGDDNKIEHEIYLFETAQPTEGSDAEKHLKRPCLIVKGKYKGVDKPCYYRVDFYGKGRENEPTEKYWDVIRNHTYNVTLSGVTGAGHNSPEAALKSQKADITATVVRWNDQDIANIDFDGTHALGIGTMKYELGKHGSRDEDLLQTVKASKGLKWTAKLHATDDQGNALDRAPDWISFVDKNAQTAHELSDTGIDDFQDLKFKVSKIDPNTIERRAVMRFTAKNLQVDALVVQDQSEPVYINVKNKAGEIITEAEFDPDSGLSELMTIEFGPAGTELTWQASSSNGINLKDAKVDGTSNGALKGTEGPAKTEDGASFTWQAETDISQTLDYGTGTGVLALLAKGKKGVASKSIKLVQTKYGVSVDNTVVPCTGETYAIKVTGNMNWTVKPVRAHDIDGDPGYEQAVSAGLLEEYNGNESGHPTDDPNAGYVVTFKTKVPEDNPKPCTFKLRFTDTDKGVYVDKTFTAAPGVALGSSLYALYGPVKFMPQDYNNNYKPADLPTGFRQITKTEGEQLREKRPDIGKFGTSYTYAKRKWIVEDQRGLRIIEVTQPTLPSCYHTVNLTSYVYSGLKEMYLYFTPTLSYYNVNTDQEPQAEVPIVSGEPDYFRYNGFYGERPLYLGYEAQNTVLIKTITKEDGTLTEVHDIPSIRIKWFWAGRFDMIPKINFDPQNPSYSYVKKELRGVGGIVCDWNCGTWSSGQPDYTYSWGPYNSANTEMTYVEYPMGACTHDERFQYWTAADPGKEVNGPNITRDYQERRAYNLELPDEGLDTYFVRHIRDL